MSRENTFNNRSFAETGKKKWYLSVKSPSPKQTLSVRFEDGKEYKYLGTGKINVGDPVIIDFGGATSYMMGNVAKTEDGITIKRTHALKPLFAFSTDPGKPELKENSKGVKDLVEVGDVAGFFPSTFGAATEDEFRVVDFLALGVLNAITVIAYQELSTSDSIREAREFLAKEKPVPGIVFSKAFTDTYYGYYMSGLRHADSAEVSLTGMYPGWADDLLGCSFWASEEYKDLKIETDWNDNKTAYYLYFTNGSKKLAKYFTECAEFQAITNELVFRSALSVLIRGGCVNLLKAALSVEMPINGFYQKLIAFADEIGSTECSALLKNEDYEHKVFEKASTVAPAGKKGATSGGKKAPTAASITADKSFKIKDGVLLEYKGQKETVEIPDGVKIIGEFAFSENKHIKKVIIPDSVTQIKKCAFSSCDELQEVVLGKGISSFGNACFFYCKSLESIDLSVTKMKTLPKETFAGCSSLKMIDLSATKINAIKEEAFRDCSSLECVKLPATLTTICEGLFRNSAIEEVFLPTKLETIESYAFYGTNVKELVIPASVKEISSSAFLGYGTNRSALKRIVFAGSAPIKFQARSVGADCVIACKGGSALLEMLEQQNAQLEADSVKYPSLGYAPRTIEEF